MRNSHQPWSFASPEHQLDIRYLRSAGTPFSAPQVTTLESPVTSKPHLGRISSPEKSSAAKLLVTKMVSFGTLLTFATPRIADVRGIAVSNSRHPLVRSGIVLDLFGPNPAGSRYKS